MERLYCPECGNYLEGGDGSMVDCHCGWKQERAIESDDEEIEQLRQRVAELETQLAKNNPLLEEAADAIDKLTAERDELLAAIKRAKYWMAGSEAKRILDEAIASVKGDAA